MKIVRMKKAKEKGKADMFAVMCLVQSAAVILTVGSLYLLSKTDPAAFAEARGSIAMIFSEDIDIGGYFTERGESGVQPLPGGLSVTSGGASSTVVLSQKTAVSDDTGKNFVSAPLSEEVFGYYSYDAVLPVVGEITSAYGYREHPVYSGESFHSGKDIAAPEGSHIYAVLDGTVIEAGTAELAGNYIKIDHGGGIETLYCHCSKLFVTEGITVRKGDVIAAVGQTGLATGPHLHFELHENGETQDPEKILSGAQSVS